MFLFCVAALFFGISFTNVLTVAMDYMKGPAEKRDSFFEYVWYDFNGLL